MHPESLYALQPLTLAHLAQGLPGDVTVTEVAVTEMPASELVTPELELSQSVEAEPFAHTMEISATQLPLPLPPVISRALPHKPRCIQTARRSSTTAHGSAECRIAR